MNVEVTSKFDIPCSTFDILVYSRGSWDGDPQVRQRWVESVESRFPALRGRVTAWQVPLDRATFRDPTTAAEIRAQVEALMELLREEHAAR